MDDLDAGPETRPPIRDLGALLLREGISLARTGGPDAVSLRDVQRRAGVSNSAAYRHFNDRAALLNAISDYAAEQMADRMRTAIGAVGNSGNAAERARARFRATGTAYLDYALTEPGLFRVAFRNKFTARSPGSGAPAHSPPFQLLVKCLDDLVLTGTLRPANRPYSDIAAWSAVHGLAILLLDGPLHGLPPELREGAIDRLLAVIDGGTH